MIAIGSGRVRCVWLITLAIISLASINTFAQASEQYTGTVIGVGGTLGGRTRPFTLTLERRNSAAEIQRALAVLAEGGQDALMSDLHSKKLGRFSMGAQLGRDVNFVQETALPDGGRRLVILFERWLNLYEIRYGTRSQDYPFTYLELTLDRSGKGAGTMIAAARIRFDKEHDNQIEIENFGIYPARLIGVKRER